MSTKRDLLDVTARLFAEHGWRGTTTRRIAEEAGVNEVTLFRHFGSKEALLGEAIRAVAQDVHPESGLPEVPVRLRGELLEWVTRQHARLRQHGSLIRTCLAEFEQHPELAPVACDGSVSAFADAARYLSVARQRGMLSAHGSIEAATVMLMNAVFMDAVTRDVIEGCRPVAETDALQEFVDLTLRALGAVEDR
jgi:AcrR family transcriptional regulator